MDAAANWNGRDTFHCGTTSAVDLNDKYKGIYLLWGRRRDVTHWGTLAYPNWRVNGEQLGTFGDMRRVKKVKRQMETGWDILRH